MNYVGPVQINAITPKDLAVGVTAMLTVQSKQTDGSWKSIGSLSVQTAAASPALFLADTIHPWIVHQDGRFDTTAAPGETVSSYGNALGPVQLGPFGLMWNVPLPVIAVNGIPAEVSFSGLQPQFVGLYQVNFTIPLGIPDGDQSLRIDVGLATSVARIKILGIKK
jgi:uncharacterized protein (TIGR03437 family)